MNLKAKIHEQRHKEAAAAKLDARIALLEEKGTEQRVIAKDPVVRMLKASMRAAQRRLTQVATMEKLKEKKLEEKRRKSEAGKTPAEGRPLKAAKASPGKEGKKEGKPKGKKSEGQAAS